MSPEAPAILARLASGKPCVFPEQKPAKGMDGLDRREHLCSPSGPFHPRASVTFESPFLVDGVPDTVDSKRLQVLR